MNVTTFLQEFSGWVVRQREVAAAALVGSYARGDATPRSDVDLVILCEDTDGLLSGDWPQTFGEIQSRAIENYGPLRSLRVRYRGLEVEFGIARPSWANVPLDPGTRAVLTDGVRILHDPDRMLEAAVGAASDANTSVTRAMP
jgi:hypothetical protein